MCGVDILVNAAAVAQYQRFLGTGESEIRHIVDTNLVGTMNACSAFCPQLIRGKNQGKSSELTTGDGLLLG